MLGGLASCVTTGLLRSTVSLAHRGLCHERHDEDLGMGKIPHQTPRQVRRQAGYQHCCHTFAWALAARVAYARHAPIPGVVTSSVARDPPGIRYKVQKSGPPKARLRTTSGVLTIPMRAHPFPSPVCSRTTVTWPFGSQRRRRLPARSTKVTEPSACQSGPSVRPQPVVSTVGSVDLRRVDRFSDIVDLLGGNRTS